MLKEWSLYDVNVGSKGIYATHHDVRAALINRS